MNLIFKLGTVALSTYKLSTIFLAMIKLKSPEFEKYETFVNNKIQKEFNINMNNEVLNQNVKTLQNSNSNEFKYMNHPGLIINQLISICKIYLTEN